MKTIIDILNTEVKAPGFFDTITIMTMIRKGKATDRLEIGLGTTGKWLELPISQVSKAEEIGVFKLNDEEYKVCNLEISRPGEENAWFDYLALVLNQLNKIPEPCGCNDNADSSSLTNKIERRASNSWGSGSGSLRTKSTYWRLACWWNGYSLSWCEQHGM